MKRYLLIVLSFFLTANIYAQKKLDSIILSIEKFGDTEKFQKLDELFQRNKLNNTDLSLQIAKYSLELAKEMSIDTLILKAYLNIAMAFSYKNMYDSSSYYVVIIQKMCQKENLKKQKNVLDIYAQSFNLIGISEYMKNDFEKAISFYLEAEKNYLEVPNDKGLANVYNNIAIIYRKLKNYTKAIEYYKKSYSLNTKLKDTLNLAISCNNIAIIYGLSSDTTNFLKYINEAIGLNSQIKNNRGLANNYHTIANHYFRANNIEEAIYYFNKSVSLKKMINNEKNLGFSYNSLADCYIKKKDLKYAQKYIDSALSISKKYNDKEVLIYAIKSQYQIDSLKGDFKKAFFNMSKYINLKDSLYTGETENKINELQTKYLTEKKDNEIKIRDLELAKNNQKIQTQKILIFTFIGGFLLLFVFILLIIKQNQKIRITNKLLSEKNIEINQQNEEIISQRDELQEKNQRIETQNNDIIASIQYAARIQKALIWQDNILQKYLKEYFLLFRPRNIVSGDFYWIKEITREKIAFAVIDCTGHGVPGAFMSILGFTFLNEVLEHLQIEKGSEKIQSSDVLDLLNKQISNSLNQEKQESETKDGMDMVFCILDYQTQTLDFAGANNPIFIVHKKEDKYELKEYKGDKFPIGYSIYNNKKFNSQKISILKNEVIYCFSDGYADQFGGEKIQKYYKINFKKLLLSIQELSMIQQKKELNNELERWMGSESQTDDILVLGVKM